MFERMMGLFGTKLGHAVSLSIRIEEGGASEIASAIAQVESDPAWNHPEGLVLVATLEPTTSPLCLASDGTKYPPGASKDWDHGPGNCSCYLLPRIWTQFMERPDGRIVPVMRPAVGDTGDQEIPFTVSVEEWLRSNPKTAKSVLGDEIACSFQGKTLNGLPLPPISLSEAAERWERAVAEPVRRFERLNREGAELYRKRDDPSCLGEAICKFEGCIPLIESALEGYRSLGRDDLEVFGAPYQQLAIIYEKQGRITEALAICEQALRVGWGGEWDKRIGRLRRKLEMLSR